MGHVYVHRYANGDFYLGETEADGEERKKKHLSRSGYNPQTAHLMVAFILSGNKPPEYEVLEVVAGDKKERWKREAYWTDIYVAKYGAAKILNQTHHCGWTNPYRRPCRLKGSDLIMQVYVPAVCGVDVLLDEESS